MEENLPMTKDEGKFDSQFLHCLISQINLTLCRPDQERERDSRAVQPIIIRCLCSTQMCLGKTRIPQTVPLALMF